MIEATFFERVQASALAGFIAICGALPLRFVSNAAGFVMRTIGPHLSISRRAQDNLRHALPSLTDIERKSIIREVWDNLGRVLVEYPHLTRMRCFTPDPDIDVHGTEHVDRALASGRSIIMFSGHLGNWETGAIAAVQYGLDIVEIYRAANNPAVEQVAYAMRRSFGVEPVAKGAPGARKLVAAIRAKRHIMMLVDQKMNDGIAVPFFGRDAMTAPAVAELALRYDCAILPSRVRRLGRSAKFRIDLEPILVPERTGDQQADVKALMLRVNQTLERWIAEDPAQWFWLHRRWPRT